MEENKDLKKVRLLYFIVIGLIILVIVIFYYFNNKIKVLENNAEQSAQMIVNTAVRVTKMSELNYLDTERFTFLTNPKNWEKDLEKEIGMTIDVPESWKFDKVVIRKSIEDNDYDYFIITMIKSDNYSFDNFVNDLYNKIQDKFCEVFSFKEGRVYYEIKSFSEATYNNMYYDYITTSEAGIETGTKPKIKILDQEDNIVKIEINKF